MKRMLINGTQPEELRVAMVDGQHLFNLDIEAPSHEKKKSNVYKGRITRVEPSLEAAFVDYGAERHGFLPLKEISPHYFGHSVEGGKRVEIRDVLKEGQEVVVQVVKEERGNKGAALTTYISLAGRYLVLMPNNPRAGGISRRIEGEDRTELRDVISELEIPEGMGVIIRTAGVGKSGEEITWDLNYLLQLWTAIEEATNARTAPFLIYQESDVIIRAIRDYLSPDIGEIIIDNNELYEKAHDFMQSVMPHNIGKLKLYNDHTPLFTRFQIENQIEAAFQHELRLPSGGSIVIDHTEALIAIDINSARATKGGDIEETALQTNLEAADEIARQLRLRDMGGLIVIDFIDMTPSRNQREVEKRLKDALKQDRARIQIGRISRFGLLELSRQRLRPSLGESAHDVCPRCNGLGVIRNVESLALSILRIIEEHASKDGTMRILAQLPVNVATFLLNEKRDLLADMEKRRGIKIFLIANPSMESPAYEITRQRVDELPKEEVPSYELRKDEPREDMEQLLAPSKPEHEKPAVSWIKPSAPVPHREPAAAEKPAETGLIKRLWTSLFGAGEEKPAEKTVERPAAARKQTQSVEENKAADTETGEQDSRGRQNRNGGRGRSGNRRGPGSRTRGNKPPREEIKPAPVKSEEPAREQAAELSSEDEGNRDQEGQQRRRSRGRRSRGGRGRRQGEGRSDQQSDTAFSGENPSAPQGGAPSVTSEGGSAPRAEFRAESRAESRTESAPSAPSSSSAPVQSSSVTPLPTTAPQEASVAKAPRPEGERPAKPLNESARSESVAAAGGSPSPSSGAEAPKPSRQEERAPAAERGPGTDKGE
ncbi:MAG: Rne/Rng family ribonuclease [Gammaproteobacteria bacterium]|nr:Rne/Rng family ribonuclease [Gammaproteobacteria bacterium]